MKEEGMALATKEDITCVGCVSCRHLEVLNGQTVCGAFMDPTSVNDSCVFWKPVPPVGTPTLEMVL